MTVNDYVLSCSVPWTRLKDKTIFITGLSGLIGQAVLRLLKEANSFFDLKVRIIGLQHKSSILKDSEIQIIHGSIDNLPEIENGIDYIIHCAADTNSASFISTPAEILSNTSSAMIGILNLAKEKRVQGLVFLSTMELYGYPEKTKKIKESDVAGFNPSVIRNSYPISKLFSESICNAYFAEYGVPVKIIRLTQTFGPGISQNDKRVFAEFCRCSREGKDIVLKTEGLTERAYLYSFDAATAILTVLLKGEAGSIYNASNPDNYCSIRQLAEAFAKESKKPIKVLIKAQENKEYCETLFMNLDISKLEDLGWKPFSNLKEMIYESLNG